MAYTVLDILEYAVITRLIFTVILATSDVKGYFLSHTDNILQRDGNAHYIIRRRMLDIKI